MLPSILAYAGLSSTKGKELLPLHLFDKYQDRLSKLPLPAGARYERDELLSNDFLLFETQGLSVFYAPFHFFNPDARLVLIGITPGWTQMEVAFRAATWGLAEGMRGEELYEYVDRAGSFSGPLRSNLVRMLDDLELAPLVGLSSSADLFKKSSTHAAFTSVVSAPIFKRGGENYSGISPPMLDNSEFREWMTENLAQELTSAPHAIVIPLGRVASRAVDLLSGRDPSLAGRTLTGFPHPSGSNGWRKQHFEQGRDHWKQQLRSFFSNQP